ncbi:MAG: DUF4340 domain-containing protein [Phycisphaerales bacterium]|nr:DUF4340 domain-containing protein [Phycisphaerales bacterium]
MKPRTLIILGIVTAGTAGLAAYTMVRESARVTARDQSGPAFAGLGDRINDVAQVRVVHGKDELTINRTADGWAIAQRGGYPAKPEKIREAVVALTELEFTEPRTSNPSAYPEIGVQDPADGADSTLVELKDAKGGRIAGLIIGENKPGGGFIAEPTFFARREGEPQSWVARPGAGTQRLEASTDPMQWVERSILGIGKDRVKSAQIVHADGQGTVLVTHDTKESADFRLADMPAGAELLFPTSPERVASALAFVSMDGVSPAAEHPITQPDSTAEYRTFDGLLLTVRAKKDADKTFVAFDAAIDPAATTVEDATKKEAADLHARLSPWVFEVPEFQAKNFMSRMSDLLKPPPGEKPPNLPEGVQPMDIPGPPQGPIGPAAPPDAPPPAVPPQPPPGQQPSPVAPPR